MKPVVIGLGIGALALGGYVYMSGLPQGEAPGVTVVEEEEEIITPAPVNATSGIEEGPVEDSAAASETPAPTGTTEAADAEEAANQGADDVTASTLSSAAEQVIENAAEQATQAAERAAEQATEETRSALQSLADGLEEAASQAVEEAGEQLVDQTAEQTVEQTAEQASEQAGGDSTATDDATAAATATEDTATEGTAAAAELLTLEGFDFAKVVALIEASDLDAAQKTVLLTTLDQTRNNPALLEQILTRTAEALGLN
ncbi:hypothetical protein [Phaeobacter sp.]|uniref:hypothetical protein n=1 Tax=Phaeobacter sp. TaxID=1902409 RepID=UPI0025FF4B01|nr:hypothetical protein [Phaeobacter sp.]